MQNLWEKDINNPSECRACAHDIAYVMPYREEGLLNLHLNMFELTGISSILFAAHLYRTDIEGNVIEDLGAINAYNNKALIYGTTKPGRYDIFIPAPCGKGGGVLLGRYQCTLVTGTPGTTVSASLGNLGSDPYDVEWVIGEPAPHPVYQIGKRAYIINDKVQGTILGPGLTSVSQLFPPTTQVQVPCHRYKFVIDYTGSGGKLYEFYTVPFQCASCNEDVVEIESTYPDNTIDCEGQIQTDSVAFSTMPAVDAMLIHRLAIYGYTKKLPSRMTINYSTNCFHNSSERIERKQLLGRAIPDWLQADFESVMMGKNLFINNENLMIEGESLTEEQELELAEFQNINVALRTCDCTINFVC